MATTPASRPAKVRARDLYDELRASHEIQRALCKSLTGSRTPEKRREVFLALDVELAAHAAAEERYLYVPMLMHDGGLSVSRHALSEHHEMEELVDELRTLSPSGDAWREKARELAHRVRHHLDEEERAFFQLSGRILTDTQKARLAGQYRRDYERLKRESA